MSVFICFYVLLRSVYVVHVWAYVRVYLYAQSLLEASVASCGSQRQPVALPTSPSSTADQAPPPRRRSVFILRRLAARLRHLIGPEQRWIPRERQEAHSQGRVFAFAGSAPSDSHLLSLSMPARSCTRQCSHHLRCVCLYASYTTTTVWWGGRTRHTRASQQAEEHILEPNTTSYTRLSRTEPACLPRRPTPFALWHRLAWVLVILIK
jgi:hypothetical protein